MNFYNVCIDISVIFALTACDVKFSDVKISQHYIQTILQAEHKYQNIISFNLDG